MLDFERPLAELQSRIEGLRTLPSAQQLSIRDEIERLEKKSLKLMKEIYQKLTPWQKVLVARHPERPKTADYIQRLIHPFVPLAGDRRFAEDSAIVGGIGKLRGMPVVIIGHEKGHDTPSRLKHNFGMAHPEGYRKVIRLMELAHRFDVPLVMLVDTPGAYAGTGAEERGQSEALAACLEQSLSIKPPILSVVIGEGGSGGAVAMATANHIAMLEHSVYSVISPEGCASILWRTAEKKEEAAVAQKLTAQDLLSFGVIDSIIPEPLGGAHRNKIATIDGVADHLCQHLLRLQQQPDLQAERRHKFLQMGRQYLTP